VDAVSQFCFGKDQRLQETYTYIKEVYLHGFMYGEGVGKFEEQSFKIY